MVLTFDRGSAIQIPMHCFQVGVVMEALNSTYVVIVTVPSFYFNFIVLGNKSQVMYRTGVFKWCSVTLRK
jgi:hypothetical protein